MKGYRICEYENGLGKKQYTIEHKWLFWWFALQSFDPCSGVGFTLYFNSRKKAEKELHLYVNRKFKKSNCYGCED